MLQKLLILSLYVNFIIGNNEADRRNSEAIPVSTIGPDTNLTHRERDKPKNEVEEYPMTFNQLYGNGKWALIARRQSTTQLPTTTTTDPRNERIQFSDPIPSSHRRANDPALSFQSTTIGFSNSRINPSVQQETPVTTRVFVNQPLFTAPFLYNTNCPTYGCFDANVCCPKWKLQGLCHPSSGWMACDCRLSCGFCYTSLNYRATTECLNVNDALCEGWARNGQCIINPSYMLQHCKKSCRVCIPMNILEEYCI